MLHLNYPINIHDSTDTLYRRMRYEDSITGHRLMSEHTVVEIVRSRVDGLGTPNTDTVMLAANSTNWDDFLARMFFDPSSPWGLERISGTPRSFVTRITLTSTARSDGNDDDGIGTMSATCVFDALITTAQLVSNLILSHNGVRAKRCGDVLLNILVPLIQHEKEKHLSLRKAISLNEILTNLADRANISINLTTINLKRLMHIEPTRAAVSWTSLDIQTRELISKYVPTRHRVFNIMFIDVNQVTHMKMSLRAYRDHVTYTTHLDVAEEDMELLMHKHTEDPWSNQINAIKYHRGGQLAAIHFKNLWLTAELTNIRLDKIKEQCLEVRLGGHVAQFVKLACADFLSWNMTDINDKDWTTRPFHLLYGDNQRGGLPNSVLRIVGKSMYISTRKLAAYEGVPIITDFRTTNRILGPGFYMYKIISHVNPTVWEKVVTPMGLHLVTHVDYSPVIIQMRQLGYRIQIIAGCWGWRTVDCLDVVYRHSFDDVDRKIVDDHDIPVYRKVFEILQESETDTYRFPSHAHAEVMTKTLKNRETFHYGETINGDAVVGVNTTNDRAFVAITATVKSLTRFAMLEQLQTLALGGATLLRIRVDSIYFSNLNTAHIHWPFRIKTSTYIPSLNLKQSTNTDPTDVDRLAGSKHVCCNIKGLTHQDQVDAYLQFAGESDQPQFAMEHVNIREGPAGTGKSYTAVLGDVGVMRELHGSFLTTNTNTLVNAHKSKIFHHSATENFDTNTVHMSAFTCNHALPTGEYNYIWDSLVKFIHEGSGELTGFIPKRSDRREFERILRLLDLRTEMINAINSRNAEGEDKDAFLAKINARNDSREPPHPLGFKPFPGSRSGVPNWFDCKYVILDEFVMRSPKFAFCLIAKFWNAKIVLTGDPVHQLGNSSLKWMVITCNLKLLNSAKVSRLPNISYYRYTTVQRFDTGDRINELVAKLMEIRTRLSEDTIISASYQEFQIKSMLKQHFPKVFINRSQGLQLFYDSRDSHMNYLISARRSCPYNVCTKWGRYYSEPTEDDDRPRLTESQRAKLRLNCNCSGMNIIQQVRDERPEDRVIYRTTRAYPAFNIATDRVMSRTRMQQLVESGVPQGIFPTCCGFTVHQFQGRTVDPPSTIIYHPASGWEYTGEILDDTTRIQDLLHVLRLFYTFVSRCRRISQIFVIDDTLE